MKIAILWTLIVFGVSGLDAMEKEAVVIEVRKKVKLHKTERVYSDYFINGGTKLGLDTGAVVSVVRRVPVHDPFLNSSIGDFRIKVAEVEIIQADAEKAIARLMTIDRSAERPMVGYDSIMVGDRLDLKTVRAKSVAKAEPFVLPAAPNLIEEISQDPNVSLSGARTVSSREPIKPLPQKETTKATGETVIIENKAPKLTNPAPR